MNFEIFHYNEQNILEDFKKILHPKINIFWIFKKLKKILKIIYLMFKAAKVLLWYVQPWNWKYIDKCGRNKLQFHFDISGVSALGVLLLLLLLDDKVVGIACIVAFFWRRATKLDLEVVKVACKKHFTKFILFVEGTLLYVGRGTNCSLYY
jgi:hypothetical protein